MLSPTGFCNVCQKLPPLYLRRGGGNFWQKYSKQNTDFTFEYVKKKCREYGICDFIKASANKKDVANNPGIIYRNKYLKIKLL